MSTSRLPHLLTPSVAALSAALVALALPAAAHAGGTPWEITITDLGVLPGGIFSSAYAINDQGVIAGVATAPGIGTRPVRWVNGVIEILPGPIGGSTATPEDINNAGVIAGRYSISSDQSYAVRWEPDGTATLLPGLPGGPPQFAKAHAINDAGLIVGRAQEGSPNLWGHAVTWVGTAFGTDLGFLPTGNFSEAFGVNDLGEIVGIATVGASTQHAFLWKNGTMIDLKSWPGTATTSKAYAINNAGTIVGQNGNFAAMWKNGTAQLLPMPPGVSAFTAALDINDAGDIIATGTKIFPIEVGVVWKDGVAMELGFLPGGTISRARRINELGEIVGEANGADGFFHAVKWTITPKGGTCTGDLNATGAVDAADLAILLGAWGSASPTIDLDGNGTVGAEDLALLLGAWGACPP